MEQNNIDAIVESLSNVYNCLLLDDNIFSGADVNVAIKARQKIEKVFTEQGATIPTTSTLGQNLNRDEIEKKIRTCCFIAVKICEECRDKIGSRFCRSIDSAKDAIVQLMHLFVRNRKKNMNLFKIIISRKTLKNKTPVPAR